jgi:hypothetical protein
MALVCARDAHTLYASMNGSDAESICTTPLTLCPPPPPPPHTHIHNALYLNPGTVWTITGNGTLVGFAAASGNRSLSCSCLAGDFFTGGIALARDGLAITVSTVDNGGKYEIIAVGV